MLRFDRLESVNVEVWPTRVGRCWGWTNSSRSLLRFGQLESVNIEVWPTRDGQCRGLTDSSRSMLRFDRLESVSVEVWPTQVGQCWGLTNSNSFIKQDISVGHFWWSNSVSNIGGGGVGYPSPPSGTIPVFHAKTRHLFLFTYYRKCVLWDKIYWLYTGIPLGSRDFGWGESIYKHKRFLNCQAPILGGGFALHTPPIFLMSNF